ncbi:DUF748 domain-containing protein [Aquincola sp. MAHUQ-54]|uniref:DUF748 domain-containing protein n=1 Tax=Aquincola agrisoli TaxID=3119538 RepID=A0AAW9QB51_9BURK
MHRLGLAVLVLAAAWLLLWLAVPPLLKSQAQQRLSALLGREVTIGAIDFAPWALALTVSDLRIASAAGASAPAQLEVGRLHVNATAASLLRWAPVVEALEIDDPVLRVARVAEGRLDVDDVLARLAPPPQSAPSEPARFALYNLQLRGGRVLVDDQSVATRHDVSGLTVSLPFLSNLPADIAVKVEPRLAFQLDGSPFDTGAQVLPFSEVRSGRVALRVIDLNLSRWAAYVPPGAPARPQRGSLSTTLDIEFSIDAAGVPTLALRGTASLRDVALADASGAPLAAWQQLQVELADVQPLARRLAFGAVQLDGLQLEARRSVDGRVNLADLAGGPPAPPAPAASPTPAGAASAKAAPLASPWQVSVQSFRLGGAAVRWQDAAVSPAAALKLDGVEVAAGPFSLADGTPMPLRWSARLAGAGAGAAHVTGEGRAGPAAAALSVDLQDLDLAWLAPYVAEHLVPRLSGRVALQGRLDWAAGDAPRLAFDVDALRVSDLRLDEAAGARAPLASWRVLALADSRVDLLAREVAVGRLTIEQPQLDVARAADGSFNLAAWLRASPSGTAATGPAPPAAPVAGPAWQLRLREWAIDGGRVRWRDARPANAPLPVPVALQLSGLRVAGKGLAWPSGPRAAPAQLQVSARLSEEGAVRAGEAARIEWSGQLAPDPLLARGELRIERLPVHALAPYAPTGLQLVLAHADAGWRGRVSVQHRPTGVDVAADGDAQLTDVQLLALTPEGAAGDELLNWQRFDLKGLRVRLAPGAAPSVEVAEAALSDFYSRLVITEQGRFNLRDVAAPPAAAASAPAEPARTVSAPALASASAAASAASRPEGMAEVDTGGLPLVLSVGSTRITNGRVDFTDRFVKPNYSAALSELNGTLGAFRAGSREMATLALRGRVAGTGLLDVSGALNPTADPLALDIRAKATEIELAPLSPYAGRYAGYAIERGKLSMDVAYRIDPDGQLAATNRIVLNQLTFGERVDSPDATKLPVTLAIALLKDRNGVIDLDLPVSGSINDPQFSVFGIVMKIIGNLLVKAITAPFSLLSGGGDDLSVVEFLPGTDRLAPAGLAAVDKVAKALADRPGLSLTVSGSSDPVAERDAIRAAALEARLEAERRRGAPSPATAASAASAPEPIPAGERAALLRRVYADTRLPDKPRNLIGLAKDLPDAEMESRLKAVLPVTEEGARALALQRGAAVRDALLAKGLPSDRIFLAAPKLRGEEAAGPADAASAPKAGEVPAAWTPRAQLVLSAR